MAQVKVLEMSDEDKNKLETISHKRTLESQITNRARMLLYKADGWTAQQIADKLDVNINTVNLCIRKYKEGGVERALYDDARSGRKPRITDDDKAWVISVACAGPQEMGLPQEFWTYSALTAFIRSHAVTAGYPALEKVSQSKIFRILTDSNIKPQRVKYYCEKRDPDFSEKMHNILVVYKQIEMQIDENGNVSIPDEGPIIHTVSCDEKPGIQVLESYGELHPDAKHGYVGRDYEYKRHGTISLLAGLDLLTGWITPIISDTHCSIDFIHLLEALDKQYPQEDIIRIICDNHSIHTSKEVQEYLKTKPKRFVFEFTPNHGSWLNLIEMVFSKLSKQMLRGISAKTKEELKRRILEYFEACNKDPVIFRWYYKMDEISEEEAKAKKYFAEEDTTEAKEDTTADSVTEIPEKIDSGDKPAKKPRRKKQKDDAETPKEAPLKKGKKDPDKAKEIKMAATTPVTHSTMKSRRTRLAWRAKKSTPSTGTENPTI